MQAYSTEIYLPCKIPSLSYTSRRKAFSNEELARRVGYIPMSAIPFYSGALLFVAGGAFFVDDFDMMLTIENSPKLLGEHLLDNPQWKRELEELNALGVIAFSGDTGSIYYSKEVLASKSRYDSNSNWANFSLSPIVLELDVTNTCNCLCIHCSRVAIESRRHLGFDKIESIFHQAKRYHIPELLLMGGEPLLHPDVEKILKTARECEIKAIRTSTNGILVNEYNASMLAEYTNHVQVSIHGATDVTHQKVTGVQGSFEKACNAVRLLSVKDVEVAVSFTVLSENEHEISDMPELALKIGAKSLRFLALSNVGRGRGLEQITDEKRDTIGAKIQELYHIYREKGLDISVGGFPALTPIPDNATFYGCAAGRTHYHVAYDSVINPCGSVDGYPVTDLQHSNLLDAWHDPSLKVIRLASKCKCSYKIICSGACKADTDFAKNFNREGDYGTS